MAAEEIVPGRGVTVADGAAMVDAMAVDNERDRGSVRTEGGLLDALDLPFDDHLGEITVPILAVGAGGYFGNLIEYTTTLLCLTTS